MENLISIFWLLFIAASALIPAITKARREAEAKRAKAAKKAVVPAQDAAPTALSDHKAAKPHFAAATSLQENNIVSEFGAGDVSEELAEETQPGSCETADFDLRKAVIYSEILKPKFDE